MSTTLTDVRCVAVPVRDQDAALSFYVDTLGFELRMDAPISDTHPSTSLRKLFAPRSIVTAGRTRGSQVINTDRLRRSFSLGSFACAI